MNYILGNLSLLLLIITSCYYTIISFRKHGLVKIYQVKIIIFSLSFSAIIILANAYLTSDFQLLNIYLNSYQDKPIFYKLAAIWGNHEGSLLFFVFLLSTVNLLNLNQLKDKKLLSLTQRTILFIVFLFTTYIFITSNPFTLNKNYVINGLGLNPILQDVALIIHPPILYLGYIFSFVIFAYILALFRANKFTKNHLKILLKLNKLSFLTLTAGIMLGSWWAYRELGWGGYWFWDPVENLALIIWLFSLISLHSNISLLSNVKMLNWFLVSVIGNFLFIILSFFIIRSGILVSVHSFADDPYRGIFLLLIFFIMGCYNIFMLRNSDHKILISKANNEKFKLNKLNFIKIQNFLVSAVIIIVIFGVFFPILYSLINNKEIFIGASFYNYSILPFLLLMLAFMTIFPIYKKLFNPFNILIITIIAVCLIYAVWQMQLNLILLIFALTVIITNIFYRLYYKTKILKMHIAHSAFALIIMGISLNNLGRVEVERVISNDEPIYINDIKLSFENFTEGKAPNYLFARAKFKLEFKKEIFNLYPEQRYYLASDITTKEVYIKRFFLHDIYLVIGEVYSKNKVKVRFIYNPFINLIWLGALILLIQFFLRMNYAKK